MENDDGDNLVRAFIHSFIHSFTRQSIVHSFTHQAIVNRVPGSCEAGLRAYTSYIRGYVLQGRGVNHSISESSVLFIRSYLAVVKQVLRLVPHVHHRISSTLPTLPIPLTT